MSKVAVVTGGTAGIGRATAEAFAKKGWSVGIVARDLDRLREVEVALRTYGVEVLGISADVSDSKAMTEAANRFEELLGPIAVWVNNAMASVMSPFVDVTADEFKRVTEVTYLGQVYGTSAVLKHMKLRNAGTIIQISSALGIRSAPLQSAYCGAKHAVRGFTDSLRTELIHDKLKGIQLTTVYLPAVNTPQFDWVRNHMEDRQQMPDPVFDPRLCAEAVLFAAEHRRREVWVGRSTALMAIGQTAAPLLLDHQVADLWDAQLDRGHAPDNPDGNLFESVPGESKTDGRFGSRVKGTRTEFWTSRHRDALSLATVGFAALGVVLTVRSVLGLARRG